MTEADRNARLRVAEEIRNMADQMERGAITRCIIVCDDGVGIHGGTYGLAAPLSQYVGMCEIFKNSLLNGKRI